ncbi:MULTISPECIES: hypothetical protein [Nostocales]|uniref:Uncharacterized protein n=1 Tax=Tolypothrix bouteillei VB521301 TaxID=1479485 RepID=A0A0C1R1X6_9CYAN
MTTSNLLTYNELRNKVYYHFNLLLISLVGRDKSKWKIFDSYFLIEELTRLKHKLNSNGAIYELTDLANAFNSVVHEFESEGKIFHPNSLVIVKAKKVARIMSFIDHTSVKVSFYKEGFNGKLESRLCSVNLSDIALLLKKDPLA